LLLRGVRGRKPGIEQIRDHCTGEAVHDQQRLAAAARAAGEKVEETVSARTARRPAVALGSRRALLCMLMFGTGHKVLPADAFFRAEKRAGRKNVPGAAPSVSRFVANSRGNSERERRCMLMTGKPNETLDPRAEQCLERATDCDRRAGAAQDRSAKEIFIEAANSWRALAAAFSQLKSIRSAEFRQDTPRSATSTVPG